MIYWLKLGRVEFAASFSLLVILFMSFTLTAFSSGYEGDQKIRFVSVCSLCCLLLILCLVLTAVHRCASNLHLSVIPLLKRKIIKIHSALLVFGLLWMTLVVGSIDVDLISIIGIYWLGMCLSYSIYQRWPYGIILVPNLVFLLLWCGASFKLYAMFSGSVFSSIAFIVTSTLGLLVIYKTKIMGQVSEGRGGLLYWYFELFPASIQGKQKGVGVSSPDWFIKTFFPFTAIQNISLLSIIVSIFICNCCLYYIVSNSSENPILWSIVLVSVCTVSLYGKSGRNNFDMTSLQLTSLSPRYINRSQFISALWLSHLKLIIATIVVSFTTLLVIVINFDSMSTIEWLSCCLLPISLAASSFYIGTVSHDSLKLVLIIFQVAYYLVIGFTSVLFLSEPVNIVFVVFALLIQTIWHLYLGRKRALRMDWG